jgi:hypothetical protein
MWYFIHIIFPQIFGGCQPDAFDHAYKRVVLRVCTEKLTLTDISVDSFKIIADVEEKEKKENTVDRLLWISVNSIQKSNNITKVHTARVFP